jgi:hypothetical protein
MVSLGESSTAQTHKRSTLYLSTLLPKQTTFIMQLSVIFASLFAGSACAFQFQAYSQNNYHGSVKNYVR